MIRIMTAAIAAGALCVTSAAAGPLGGSMTASETSGKSEARNGGGVLAFLVDRLSVSVATAATTVGYSADDSKDRGTQYSKDNCDSGESANDEETDEAQSNKKEPVGPEPIYFGF